MLTAEGARALFSYDPLTGIVTRRTTVGQRGKAGAQLSGRCGNYLTVKVEGRAYRVHRVIWLIVTGQWPANDVDHRNGRGTDNRWTNLRDVPRALNAQNQRKPTAANTSGFLGVTPYRKRWVAQIWAASRRKHIGVLDSPEAAHAAYVSAKRALHPGNTL